MDRSTPEIIRFTKELEEELHYGEICEFNDLQLHYHELYKIIEQLMELTHKEPDQDRRATLAAIEYKARQCYEHIKMRLQTMN